MTDSLSADYGRHLVVAPGYDTESASATRHRDDLDSDGSGQGTIPCVIVLLVSSLRRTIVNRLSPQAIQSRCRLRMLSMYVFFAAAERSTIADSLSQIPIYEKMGFKVVGMKDGPSPWGDWSVWVLRYEPGPESA